MPDINFIDMQALRVFLTTAEARSMSAAASQLGLTQSAVSQSIRTLEHQLGAVLLNRGGRPLALTPAGMLLAERGGALMESAMDLRAAVVEVGQGAHANLRLGLVDSFAATCGAALAQAFMARATRLSVRTGLSPDLGKGLQARDFDLIITSDPLEEQEALARHALLTERFVVIVPARMSGRPASLQDLLALANAEPLIRFNRQSHLGMQIERVLRRHGIKAARRIEVDTSDTLTSMVATGLGWALTTPLCLLQAAHLCDDIAVVAPADLVGERSIYLLAREEQHTRVVHEVIDLALTLLLERALPRLERIDVSLSGAIQIHERLPQ